VISQLNFVGRWYLKGHTVTGMVKSSEEYELGNTPVLMQLDSNGCFMLVQNINEYIYGKWHVDKITNELIVIDDQNECNPDKSHGFYKANFKTQDGFLITETIGRDTKDTYRYEKIKK